MTNTEKVAYIKGMMDGMDFQPDTPEKKLLGAVVDALESIANSLQAVEEDTNYLNDYIEELDSDLGDVEEEVFCSDDCDDDCCEDDDWDEDDEEAFYEIECPSCGKKVYLDEDMLDLGTIDCPRCGEKLELDLEECGDCETCEGCDAE